MLYVIETIAIVIAVLTIALLIVAKIEKDVWNITMDEAIMVYLRAIKELPQNLKN